MAKTNTLLKQYKAVRQASPLSTSALAIAVGLRPQTLLRLERGCNVKLSTLLTALNGLGYGLVLTPLELGNDAIKIKVSKVKDANGVATKPSK